ncbi:MAG: bifunctional phosphoribosylaminoimidazolecarboxamide formyltransferase/IMP cyclohydrolase, partial [Chitinophagales bacterium]
MSDLKIERALISVYHKDGLEPIVKKLHELGVQLISTGGTEAFIKSLDIPVVAVESLTDFPEILGGRVKTLHPAIFGGILGRRALSSDVAQMKEHEIPSIDLVIVDLYPFEETVASTNNESEIIEKIDIGGISLIRAAAKNFNDVLICASRNEYADLLRLLQSKNGRTANEDRRNFAVRAFNVTSHYDTAIFNYFNKDGAVRAFKKSMLQSKSLRYGENPHQQGTYFGDLNELFDQLNGKEISYNNLVDIDAAVALIAEFDQPACAVIKHTNPCGVAEAPDLFDAWIKALAGDPVSAFGGIIVLNRNVSKTVAEKINEIFFEVIIAPGYDQDALSILKQKKNRIIILQKKRISGNSAFKSILNGVIEQNKDKALATPDTLKTVTKVSPTAEQIADLLFGEKCVKHLKSNTIVLAKNSQLVGMGCGQT